MSASRKCASGVSYYHSSSCSGRAGLKEWNFPFSRGGGISDGHFIITFFFAPSGLKIIFFIIFWNLRWWKCTFYKKSSKWSSFGKKLLHIFQLIGGLGGSRPKSGKFHFFIFIHWKGSKIFFWKSDNFHSCALTPPP